MKYLVFVYGTLKHGFVRHQALQHQRYLGVARTEPIYAMFRVSDYPAIVEQSATQRKPRSIWGELYEVDEYTLLHLDQIEGVGRSLYERKTIKLAEVTLSHLPVDASVLEKLTAKEVLGYVYKEDIPGAKDCDEFWGKSN
jgi:gamma-glutamylaminecyclotransferase